MKRALVAGFGFAAGAAAVALWTPRSGDVEVPVSREREESAGLAATAPTPRASTDTEAPRGTLSGSVRLAGVPARAAVRAWRLERKETSPETWKAAAALVRGPARPPDAEGRSDAQGRFSLAVVDADPWLLAAAADDRDAWRVATRTDADVDLAEGPHALVVRAVHGDGRPFRGLLRLSEGDRWGRSADAEPRFAVAPDAEGIATFRGLPPKLVSVVALSPPSFESSPTVILLPHSGEVRLVVDGPERTVRGRVADVDGHGIFGAEVTVEPTAPAAGTFTTRGASGADGAFVVRACAGAVRVRAAAPGFVPGSTDAPAAAQSAEVRLVRAGRIHGVARDAATGRAVAGVRVALSPVREDPYERPFRTATTDAAGRFAFDDVKAGDVSVVAFGAGWMTASLRDTPTGGLESLSRRVGPGQDVEVAIALERSARLEGRVTTVDGSPVAHARVSAGESCRYKGPSCGPGAGNEPSFLHVPKPGEVESDDDGRFVVDTLLPRLHHSIRVDAPSGASKSLEVFPGEADTVRLDVVLRGDVREPVHAVDVRVVSAEDGAPLAGASLSGTDAQRHDRAMGTTGADGGAHLESVVGLPSVDLDGFEDAEHRTEGGVEVFALKRTLVVHGRVLWPDGSPAAGVAVVHAQLKGPDVTTTDADGRFRGELRRKGFRVTAETVRGVEKFSAAADAGDGSADLLLRLAPDPSGATRHRVRIVGPDGPAVVAGHVWIEGLPPWEADVPWTEGFAEVWGKDGEAPVLHVCEAVTAGGGPPPGPYGGAVPLAAGEISLVRLPAGRTVSGRVVAAGGDGVAGVRVEARRPEDAGFERHASTLTGPDGGFVLEGLGDLDYDVVARVAPLYAALEPVRVRPGTAPVVLRPTAALRPWIDVVDRGGSPVAGARVQAVPMQTRWPGRGVSARTDADGRARLEGVSAAEPLALEVERPQGYDLQPARIESWTPADTRVVLETALVLAGTLRNRVGDPLQADLEVKGEGGRETVGGAADAGGHFRITGVAPGTVTLSVRVGDWPWVHEEEVEVSTPAADATVVVDEGETILVAPEPKPTSTMRWQIAVGESVPDEYSRGKVARGDRFLVHGVESDRTYSVYVEAGGQVATATGVRASRSALRLRWLSGAAVTGRVFGDHGPEGRCRVTVEGPGFALEEWTDEGGAFRVDHVPPGTWTVRAGEKDRVATTRAAAGAIGVELRLPAR